MGEVFGENVIATGDGRCGNDLRIPEADLSLSAQRHRGHHQLGISDDDRQPSQGRRPGAPARIVALQACA